MSKKTKDESPVKIEKLRELYDTCLSRYAPLHKKLRLLDATDRGDLWKVIGAKFPPYQILPDTNFISYVKNNLVASLYTVTKSANILPTSEQDKEIVMHLNLALDYIWDIADIGYVQLQAGERAALLNMGITQVGWNEKLTGGSRDPVVKNNIALKNIDPMKFMRDPYATSIDTAGYCMTYDNYSKKILEKNPLYKEAFKEYLEEQESAMPINIPKYKHEDIKLGSTEYYTLVTFWVRENETLYEIHTVNCEKIMHWKEIKPGVLPFAILYCNEPAGALIGTSSAAHVFANNVAYNLMDSIALTAELKNQRPPKFISSQSGLNVDAFSKHGDEADKTFIVNGDATRAVHYHQFPFLSPVFSTIKDSLKYNIQTVSGVDGRYTGRDTGSIITTGGTEEMLNRVTIIDTPKIVLYEDYAKQLTKLILLNLLEFAPKRKYFIKKPNQTKWETIEVDFPKIDKETTFHYAVSISSELPKNKQRVAQMANMLMEKQMQYQQSGSSVQLITEEEWLMLQDLPMKEYMLERMGIQRQQDAVEEVAQVLFEYADLIQQGANPDDAILGTADTLKQKRMGQAPEADAIPPVAAMPMQ